LLLQELGMDLATIGGVVDDEDDPTDALHRQHRRLLNERERLDHLAATVAATIQHLEEETDIPAEKLFDTMTPERAAYLTGLPKQRTAAGVLFTDDFGRSLVVEPTYKNYWQLPAGVVDADESHLTATERALSRELGLSIKPGRLLVVDWVPPSPNRIEGLLFVYDGATLSSDQSSAITLPPGELRRWAWCTESELQDRLPAHMLRRTQAALRARTDGTTLYLENGSAA
jgi:8-oxo-dGTP diphosphatase